MEPVRAGFIGGGTIATWHADRLTDLGHEVEAVAEIDSETKREFAATYDASLTFEEYEMMIEEADLDVVVVAVPNALHPDCAIAALEADVDVFVEKPLAATLDGAQRIAAAESHSDGTVMVGFMKAFDPTVNTLRNYMDGEEFGSVYEVSVEYVRQRGIPQLGSWFTSKEVAGGGALIDIGPHMLHLALDLLEFPDIEAVSAETSDHFGSKQEDYTYLSMWGGDPVDDPVVDVEDTVRALVRTEDGATIHMKCAWASNSERRQEVQVLGTEAGATISPDDDTLDVHGTKYDAISSDRLETKDGDPYRAEWEYFVEVLRGEREHTRNTVAEGLLVQQLIESIYRSADQGEEVAFEDVLEPELTAD
jgi:predicted dehydrogenase